MAKKHTAAGRGLPSAYRCCLLCSRLDSNQRSLECNSSIQKPTERQEHWGDYNLSSVTILGRFCTVGGIWTPDFRNMRPVFYLWTTTVLVGDSRVWTNILLVPACYSRTSVLQGHLTNWNYVAVVWLGIEPSNLTLPLKDDTRILWSSTTIAWTKIRMFSKITLTGHPMITSSVGFAFPFMLSNHKKSSRIRRTARPAPAEFPLSSFGFHVQPKLVTVPECALLREGSRPLWLNYSSIQGIEPQTSGLHGQYATYYTIWIFRLLSFRYLPCTAFPSISSTPPYYHCAGGFGAESRGLEPHPHRCGRAVFKAVPARLSGWLSNYIVFHPLWKRLTLIKRSGRALMYLSMVTYETSPVSPAITCSA